MSVAGLIEALARWLPVPLYDFRGGPWDGQRRAVELIATDHGTYPPTYLHAAEFPPMPTPTVAMVMPEEVTYRVWTYRFVATNRIGNCGYYECTERRD